MCSLAHLRRSVISFLKFSCRPASRRDFQSDGECHELHADLPLQSLCSSIRVTAAAIELGNSHDVHRSQVRNRNANPKTRTCKATERG